MAHFTIIYHRFSGLPLYTRSCPAYNRFALRSWQVV